MRCSLSHSEWSEESLKPWGNIKISNLWQRWFQCWAEKLRKADPGLVVNLYTLAPYLHSGEGGAVRTVIGFWGQLSVFVQPELSVFVRSEFSICLELNPVFVSSAPKCIVLHIWVDRTGVWYLHCNRHCGKSNLRVGSREGLNMLR